MKTLKKDVATFRFKIENERNVTWAKKKILLDLSRTNPLVIRKLYGDLTGWLINLLGDHMNQVSENIWS